jgi:hypothetical protein
MITCLAKTLVVFAGGLIVTGITALFMSVQVFAQAPLPSSPKPSPTPKLELLSDVFFDEFPLGITKAWSQIDPDNRYFIAGPSKFNLAQPRAFQFGKAQGGFGFWVIAAEKEAKDASTNQLIFYKAIDSLNDRWQPYRVTHNLDLSQTWLSNSNWGLIAIEEGTMPNSQKLCSLGWDDSKQSFICFAKPWQSTTGKALEPAVGRP